MKAVIQRVSQAEVKVNGETTGRIGPGLLVLLGVAQGDTTREVRFLCSKMLQLRIFSDVEGRMNRSLLDIQGKVLLVSQFTLLGNIRKGRRPNFMEAASPDVARVLYTEAVELLGQYVEVETGIFGSAMELNLTNDGPVTFILETPSG